MDNIQILTDKRLLVHTFIFIKRDMEIKKNRDTVDNIDVGISKLDGLSTKGFDVGTGQDQTGLDFIGKFVV